MKETTRVLVIEDDPDVGGGLELLLASAGHDVERCADATCGLDRLRRMPLLDAALLDVMLPERSGFEVLREARRGGVDVPIIMITALGSSDDRLRGFHLGADDYITKPFQPQELLARVNAVIRRSRRGRVKRRIMSLGDLEVDFERRSVRRRGRTLDFTSLEFDILCYFIEHRGRTVSRKQMLREIWGISGEIETRTIDRHVASLRKKIEPNVRQPQFIETVYGVGYKLRPQ